MLKSICFVLLFAFAAAQIWGQPLPIHPVPPNWNQPPPPPPNWNQPPPPPPNWNPPMNPRYRDGVLDSRCPTKNGPMPTIFSHDNNCRQFYMCNDGYRCKKYQKTFC